MNESLDSKVFDFSFGDYDRTIKEDDALSQLTRLTAIAGKLKEAGWPFGLTFNGLGFNVPNLDSEDGDDLYAIVKQRLKGIGIEDPFEMESARTLEEVRKVEDKLCNRIWYDRSLVNLQNPDYDRQAMMRENPDIMRGMLRAMQKVEQECLEEEFPYEDDFSWGMLNGRLAALRWVLGDDWEFLDT